MRKKSYEIIIKDSAESAVDRIQNAASRLQPTLPRNAEIDFDLCKSGDQCGVTKPHTCYNSLKLSPIITCAACCSSIVSFRSNADRDADTSWTCRQHMSKNQTRDMSGTYGVRLSRKLAREALATQGGS